MSDVEIIHPFPKSLSFRDLQSAVYPLLNTPTSTSHISDAYTSCFDEQSESEFETTSVDEKFLSIDLSPLPTSMPKRRSLISCTSC